MSAPTVKLFRYCRSAVMGVFGYFEVEGQLFHTVECPWKNNEPSISCIPPGTYSAGWMATTTFVPLGFKGKTWYLYGNTVGYDVGHRTRIAIHIANTVDDIQGCIGVGLREAVGQNGKWSVGDSTDALEKMRELLPDQFKLIIFDM